jgi:hypothetical protein
MSLKNVVIGIAIMILTISVVVYGVNTFYKSPEYEDFCGERGAPRPVDGREVCPAVCVELYEIRADECVFNNCGSGCGPNNETSFLTLAECEQGIPDTSCYELYDNAREKYSRNIFLIAIPLGIAIIALGALVFGLEAVGAGLMAGGVGIIFWGVGGFWQFAQDWLKFLLSLIGLAILIWLAYYFNQKFGKKKKK